MLVLSAKMRAVLASVAAADFYAVAPGLQSSVPVAASSAAYALPTSAYAAPAAFAQDEAAAVQYMPYDAAQYQYVSQAQTMTEPPMSSGLVALIGAGVGLAAGYVYTPMLRRILFVTWTPNF